MRWRPAHSQLLYTSPPNISDGFFCCLQECGGTTPHDLYIQVLEHAATTRGQGLRISAFLPLQTAVQPSQATIISTKIGFHGCHGNNSQLVEAITRHLAFISNHFSFHKHLFHFWPQFKIQWPPWHWMIQQWQLTLKGVYYGSLFLFVMSSEEEYAHLWETLTHNPRPKAQIFDNTSKMPHEKKALAIRKYTYWASIDNCCHKGPSYWVEKRVLDMILLETGYPKCVTVKFMGILHFKGDQITTIKMNFPSWIKALYGMGLKLRWKNQVDVWKRHFRKLLTKNGCVLRGDFEGLGVQMMPKHAAG